MSLTKIMGQSTTFNEDIRAFYYAPLKEYDFEKNIKESNYTTSISDLKNAWKVANNQVKIENEDEIDKTQYFEEEGILFFGKDGTSDAYVKRGLDTDLISYFERQETNKRSWRFSTSVSHINFKSGGKVIVGKKEWIILKVINQLSTNDIENQLKARMNMDFVEDWGYKTLILA